MQTQLSTSSRVIRPPVLACFIDHSFRQTHMGHEEPYAAKGKHLLQRHLPPQAPSPLSLQSLSSTLNPNGHDKLYATNAKHFIKRH
eukprot:1052328-Pelagomonas_calceolata.AAC.1